MMMRHVLMLLAGLAWAAGAVAQTQDCSKAPAGYRSRCEEATRLRQICAGLKDAEMTTCTQKNIHYARMKSDCSLANTPEKKTRCAEHNQRMDLLAPCSGKTGDAFKACADAAGVQGAGATTAAPDTPAPKTAPKPASAPTPAAKTAANVPSNNIANVTPNAASGVAPR